MGQALKMVTLVNGKEIKGPEAERVRIEASYMVTAGRMIRQESYAEEREKYRPADVDDRPSIKRAMIAVETRLVAALWTLARLPSGGSGGGSCGIAYIQDASDRWGNAIERGWDALPPRPPAPSGRAIDAMHEPLDWLRILRPDQADLVRAAAESKRGEAERNVTWGRVRNILPWAQSISVRRLQRMYEAGIRAIATELFIRNVQ